MFSGGFIGPNYSTRQWQQQQLQAQADAKAKAEWDASLAKIPGAESYAPAAGAAMMDSYKQYQEAAQERAPKMGNLAGDFEANTAAYDPYTWRNMNEVYDQYDPGAYQETGYTFGDDYSPVNVDAYQYSDPNIDQVSDISGVPGDIWSEISRNEEMSTRKGYEGQRAEMARRLAAGGGGRGGMSAVLNAQLGSQEEGDVQRARRQVAMQQAMQGVGIAQQTQALQAQRSTSQAGLESRTDEMQAQEIARKQGIDIEDARYRVNLMKQKQELGSQEKKYGYESGTANAKYRTGLEQAYDEAGAAESRAGQEWNYNRNQDIYNAKLTQHQQEAQDVAARQQAALSGGQLAQGMMSQAGSYDIQKNPDTNNDDYKAGVQNAWDQYKAPAQPEKVAMAPSKNDTKYKNLT